MGAAMNTTVAVVGRYFQLPYAVQIVPDECDGQRCYMAKHPELRGCMAQGWDPEEALANLDEARRDYLTTLVEMGLEVPLPKSLQATVHTAHAGVIGQVLAGPPAFEVRQVLELGIVSDARTITRSIDVAEPAVH
jgi:predicted RNase H-like HicB family nuclease